MKYLKCFEAYGSSILSELVEQFDDDYIENFFAEHLAYTDIDEIIQLWPSIIWNHIDDERAIVDIIDDESNNRELEELIYEAKELIKMKYLDEEDQKRFYDKYIEDEVDLDELKELKTRLRDEDDEDKKELIQDDIDYIQEQIDDIKNKDFDDLIDDMDNDSFEDVVSDIYDSYDIIHEIVEERYSGMSLQEYVEEIWGNIDTLNIEKDMPWILNYVDEDAVLKEYNDNEEFYYKKERVEEYIESTPELQEKLLNIDRKNALLLFDLFKKNNWTDSKNTIAYEYFFQKAYIEEYAIDYAEGDQSDLSQGRAIALKKLYKNFNLDNEIEEEYSDDMYLVSAEKYNL